MHTRTCPIPRPDMRNAEEADYQKDPYGNFQNPYSQFQHSLEYLQAGSPILPSLHHVVRLRHLSN